MKKLLISVITFIVLVASLTLSVSAASAETSVNPRYANVLAANVSMVISRDGLCTTTISYVGKVSDLRSAKITTKVQKNVSGSWVDVNIGQPNNQWVDESTSPTFTRSHSVQLTSHGTYRAVVVYEISGTGGATDVIERTIEKTY